MFRSFLFFSCLLFGLVAQAQASIVSFQVSGTIDTVDPTLAGGGIAVGDTFTVTYSFDDTTPARSGSDSNFAVFDALTSFNVTAGTYIASSNGAPEIQVDNDPPAPNDDRYAVISRASDGLTGAAINGNDLTFAGFRLDDSTNAVFSDALILPTTLDLNDFDSNNFIMFFNDFVVFGKITSIQPVAPAVPEPASMSVMLTLLVGGLAIRRRYAA